MLILNHLCLKNKIIKSNPLSLFGGGFINGESPDDAGASVDGGDDRGRRVGAKEPREAQGGGGKNRLVSSEASKLKAFGAGGEFVKETGVERARAVATVVGGDKVDDSAGGFNGGQTEPFVVICVGDALDLVSDIEDTVGEGGSARDKKIRSVHGTLCDPVQLLCRPKIFGRPRPLWGQKIFRQIISVFLIFLLSAVCSQ
jgi:hypothetical protein